MINAISSLVRISKFAGERFDLIQAGGGNSSVKYGKDLMLIKSSGVSLSELTEEFGFSIIDLSIVREIFQGEVLDGLDSKYDRENFAQNVISTSLQNNSRPSIETTLHAFLYKFTLHTHPVVLNILLARLDCDIILSEIFRDLNYCTLPYKTPGIELSIELNNKLSEYKNPPKVYFLKNHGLIVSSDVENEIYYFTELVLDTIEKYLSVDFSRYKTVTKFSNLLKNKIEYDGIVYLSEDRHIYNELINNADLYLNAPFCPDGMVFCGYRGLKLSDLDSFDSIKEYLNEFKSLPKIVYYKNHLFILAKNTKKAKEIEEVLKFQIIVFSNNMGKDIQLLDREELDYLNNWEAEKHRQKI